MKDKIVGVLFYRGVLKQFLKGLFIAVIFILSLRFWGAYIQPYVDTHRNVISEITYTQEETKGPGLNKITLNVRGRKILDCYYVPNSELGEAYLDGSWSEIEFEYWKDPVPNSTRGVSEKGEYKSFGLWRWKGDMSEVNYLRYSITHLCNYTTKSIVDKDGKTSIVYEGDRRRTYVVFKVNKEGEDSSFINAGVVSTISTK